MFTYDRWPCGLRLSFATARLLGSRVRISQRALIFVSCVCYVLCRYRSLRRADLSFREVLPTLCVSLYLSLSLSNCVNTNRRDSRKGTPSLIIVLWFYIHRSVHRNIFLQYNQQNAPVSQIIYSCKTLYMFRTVFPSIIRSSKLHTRQLAYVKQLLLPAASGRSR